LSLCFLRPQGAKDRSSLRAVGPTGRRQVRHRRTLLPPFPFCLLTPPSLLLPAYCLLPTPYSLFLPSVLCPPSSVVCPLSPPSSLLLTAYSLLPTVSRPLDTTPHSQTRYTPQPHPYVSFHGCATVLRRLLCRSRNSPCLSTVSWQRPDRWWFAYQQGR
jgi:hypothetical protein